MNKQIKEQMQELEKRFKEAYKEAKKMGFEKYYISCNNGIQITWEDMNTLFESRVNLPKEALSNLKKNLDIFFKSRANLEKFIKAKMQEQKNEH